MNKLFTKLLEILMSVAQSTPQSEATRGQAIHTNYRQQGKKG